MASDHDITKHHASDPGADVWVNGPPRPEPIVIADYDPAWPEVYADVAQRVRGALGPGALAVDHVGSTAVPGLPAKPVIDVDLTVADPAGEDAYVGVLQDAGFVLVVREPAWHQHRCFRLAEPRVNLHVFGPGCPELVRHRQFRDWLRSHPGDLARYRDAKRVAAAAGPAQGSLVMDYNRRKEAVIREIYERIFRAHGMGTTAGGGSVASRAQSAVSNRSQVPSSFR